MRLLLGKCVLLSISLAACASLASLSPADTLALFDGGTSSVNLTVPAVLAPHLSAELTYYAGWSLFNGHPGAAFSYFDATSLKEALSNGSYVGITLTPDAGYAIDLTAVDFDLGIRPTANLLIAQGFALTNLEGFTESSPTVASAATLGLAGSPTATWTTAHGTSVASNALYQGLTSPLELRVYIGQSSPSPLLAPDVFLDNINIQGNVRAVPEPASLAALGLGAVALLKRRKRP
jgi:hypothetical protein